MRDNAGTLLALTTALAGIALIPFSGGVSGVLVAAAITALTATAGYLVMEFWKAGMHKWGGAAYGSDFLESIQELCGGEKRNMGLRYENGEFKYPPEMAEVFDKALKEIGKETLVFMFAGAFGKVLGVGLKAWSGNSRVAGETLVKDATKLHAALEAAALANPLTRSWGEKFMRAWVSQIPWAAVAGTIEDITQSTIKDEIQYRKDLKDRKDLTDDDVETLQFMGHVFSVCSTVFLHRVGGHIMRPRLLGTGVVEIPYDVVKFMEELRFQYAQEGKPMPKFALVGDNVIKVKAGRSVFELRFIDPESVAADLNKRGVKPKPLQPGEKPAVEPEKVTQEDQAGKPPIVERPPGEKIKGGQPDVSLVDHLDTPVLSELRQLYVDGKVTEADLRLLKRALELGLIKAEPGKTLSDFIQAKFTKAPGAARAEFLKSLELNVRGEEARRAPNKPAAPVVEPTAKPAVKAPGEKPSATNQPTGPETGLVEVPVDFYRTNQGTAVEYMDVSGTKPGYVIAEANGKFLFVPEPGANPTLGEHQTWAKIPDGYVRLRGGERKGLYFDPATQKTYAVRGDGSGLKAVEVKTEVKEIPESHLKSPLTQPLVRARRALDVGGIRVSSAANSRSITIGDGANCDIVVGKGDANGKAGAVVWGEHDGFFVQRTGYQKVTVQHADGSKTELKAGNVHRLRPTDKLVVDGKSIDCAPAIEPAFVKRPLPHTVPDWTVQGPKIDFAGRVEVTEPIKDGCTYKDTHPPDSKVPNRVIDMSHPVMEAVIKDTWARCEKLTDPNKIAMELARMVNELSAPYDSTVDAYSKVRSRVQADKKLNESADSLDAAIGRERNVQMGDLIAFKRMVCLDQAMLLKTLMDNVMASKGIKGQCKVVTGDFNGSGHAWCEVEINGKKFTYDPRMINKQTTGIPIEKATAYRPYTSPAERPAAAKTKTGPNVTVTDAIDALKKGSFDEAFILTGEVKPSEATQPMREAVRDRILSELKNPSSTARLGELAELAKYLEAEQKTPDLRDAIRNRMLAELKNPQSTATPAELAEISKILPEADKAQIKDAVKTYVETQIKESLSPRDVVNLAREFGHVEAVQEAVRARIASELASRDPMLTPLEMVKLAKEFDVFKDSVKRSILQRVVDDAITGGDNVHKMKRLLGDESGIARDPEFLDALADGISRRVANATPETLHEIDAVIRTIPELKLTEQPKLTLDKKTSSLIDEMKTALDGTEVAKEIESTLAEPEILGNNARLSDLYSKLKQSGNKKVRDFLEKHPSKDAVINAWKQQIKIRKFSEVMSDPELNRLLAKRPLAIDGQGGALAKFKELLKKAGFPESGDQIVGIDDSALRNHLRQRARVSSIQDAIHRKVEQLVKAKDAPSKEFLDQWRSLADEANEPRATNAIDYFRQNGAAFKGTFVEGIKLNEFQLKELHDVVLERDTRFTEISLEDFQQFLSRFGFESQPSSKHMKIVFKGGGEVTYLLKQDGKSNGAFNAHDGVKPIYQKNFLEGLEWLILNGRSRTNP
ncbi:MAG: hypothetical protein K2Z81_21670 [Cyanobacteria bacterium]|nr:hypothetical protein [Cyanobacteriota bacterium]